MKKVILGIVIGILVIAVGVLGFLYFNARKEVNSLKNEVSSANQKIEDIKTNPDLVAKEEVKGYIDAVNKLYALPENEEPSVATVNDKSKLKDQPFFAKAENGDITLIYTQSKLAILFRPSSGQLVNVSSVTVEDEKPAANSSTQTQN